MVLSKWTKTHRKCIKKWILDDLKEFREEAESAREGWVKDTCDHLECVIDFMFDLDRRLEALEDE